MAIKYPDNPSLGQAKVHAFPKKQYEKIVEIIDAVNDITDASTTLEELTVTGDATVQGNLEVDTDLDVTGDSNLAGRVSVAGLFYLTGTPQTLTGAGAVNVTTKVTLLVTTGANALTMGAGADGQIKIITMKTDGGDGTLTPTGLRGGTTIKFDDVGDTVTLMYKDSAWIILSNVGCTVA